MLLANRKWEHSINLGHCIEFQDTRILASRSGCMECIIKGKKD